jgi:hypothetical protein
MRIDDTHNNKFLGVPTTHRNNKTSSITSFVCFNEEM